MHLSIVTPSPKPRVAGADFGEQYLGKYGDFTAISCTSPQKITRNLRLRFLPAGWGGVFVQGFDHVFCCWLAKYIQSVYGGFAHVLFAYVLGRFVNVL